MNWRDSVSAAAMLVFAFAAASSAQPTLSVDSLGPNGAGNLQWQVSILPDASLFSQTPDGFGGSLAAEIGFDLSGASFVGADINSDVWPFEFPGRNPFSPTFTRGLFLDGSKAFVSLGSEVITSGDSVPLMTLLTTNGDGVSLSWGGHSFLEETEFAYVGARLSQAGSNFDGIEGVASTGGGGGTDGDFDGDGLLTAVDIDLLSAAVRDASGDLSFDLDGSGSVDAADRNVWVVDLKGTWFGDANLDGEFNTSDLVSVFQQGFFEQPVDAGWGAGDWNGDNRFGSGDFVAAFTGGGFEQGPRSAVMAVPEPASILLFMLGCAVVLLRRRP